MVSGLAFLTMAIAALFAESTLVRWSQRRSAHLGIWALALGMFTVAAATLAVGTSTGWDRPTFRIFYLLGAIVNVPWLALGTVALLVGPAVARKVRWFVVFFSGLATGVMLSAPMRAVHGTAIPVGKDTFGAFPRALAGIGSGVGAIVILGGALGSAIRFARSRSTPGSGHRAAANALIALGTLVLSSGGLLQGTIGHDTAFAMSLTVGITVIYAGFLIAEQAPSRPSRPTSPT